MLVFVDYDIVESSIRSKFIKRLQHYGLHRIQKSVFVGFLDIKSRLNLAEEFELFLSSERDSIIMIPVCESCSESILIEGAAKLPVIEDYTFV